MMKKSLIALAVLGASGLAMAQSSVTLYGLADAGIGRVKNPDPQTAWNGDPQVVRDATGALVTTADNIPGALQSTGKVEFLGNSRMNNAPSRVGLTGVEDIGNGTKVGFQFETHLSLEDGADTDANFWARNANVFIGGNWGTIKLGRQLTVSHITEGAYDLTGLANYSVQRNTFGLNGFVPRANDAIAYISPNFGGFTVAAAFVSKNDTGGDNVWDIGMMYNNGPISVGAAVNNGLDNGKKNYHVGAKYSFGNFAVAASYHNGSSNGADRPVYDWMGNQVGLRESIRRGFSIGGQATFGAFTATLDVARDTKNEWTGRWGWNPMLGQWVYNNKKFTNVLLEGKYALSKRTFFYGAVLRLDGYTNWGLGLSHSF